MFLRVLVWRPARAIEVAYWYLTRRRVRAANRLRDAAARAPFAYRVLIRTVERRSEIAARAATTVTRWRHRPLFSVLIIVDREASPARVDAVIRSVERQCYDHWEILVVGGGEYLRPSRRDPKVRFLEEAAAADAVPVVLALRQARGAFVVPLSDGVELAPTALFHFAETLQTHPQARVLYGDEDRIDPSGRRDRPWFKPEWNAEMFLALDYVSRACAIEVEAARRACLSPRHWSAGPAFVLALAVTGEADGEVVHVPHVAVHVRSDVVVDDPVERAHAVAMALEPHGASAEAGPFGTVTVRWPMPDPPPSVSIIIPTRDKVDLLGNCLDGLLTMTRYPNYTITIVDNGSVEPQTHAYLEAASRDPRIRVMRDDRPYNYSELNNRAVAETRSAYLCLLNNDTEIIDGNWLGEMMRYAVRPGIGAVGAKLLYADRSIQHAGVVLGLGNAAGHAHRALPDGDPGYFAQAHVAHYASAVTAACLVVERDKFLAVGGLDAEALAIAYNDVDLCLKLTRAGWRNIYAPQATLLHLESKSRGADLSPQHRERYMRELAVFQQRWGTSTIVDPMHHPRLDRASEIYRLSI
jgi:GT2 family glycosyltransferase